MSNKIPPREDQRVLVDGLIHSPDQAVTETMEYLTAGRAAISSGLGLHFPIPAIAEGYPIPPLMPGEVFTVAAVTSHGKSTFKDFWMADAAHRIMEYNSPEHILITILAEDMVESHMADMMRRQAALAGDVESVRSEDGLLTMAATMGGVPVYYIGASIGRASPDLPPNNMSNISRAVFRIIDLRQKKGLKTIIMGIFLDYIQALDLDPELMQVVIDKRRNLQVRQDFFAFRNLMKQLPAPGVCLAQCRPELKYHPGPNMQTPGLTDIQETSAIAQHTDRAISLWMPKNTHSHLEKLEHGKERVIEFRVLPNLVWMRCTKQRSKDPMTLKGLPSGRFWPLLMDFDTGEYTLTTPEDTFRYGVETRAERRAREGKDPEAIY